MFSGRSKQSLFAMVLALLAAAGGCRQMPVGSEDYERPAGVDSTYQLEDVDEGIPIEKELTSPKGFFNKRSGPYGGWSSESRDIERSLGVK